MRRTRRGRRALLAARAKVLGRLCSRDGRGLSLLAAQAARGGRGASAGVRGSGGAAAAGGELERRVQVGVQHVHRQALDHEIAAEPHEVVAVHCEQDAELDRHSLGDGLLDVRGNKAVYEHAQHVGRDGHASALGAALELRHLELEVLVRHAPAEARERVHRVRPRRAARVGALLRACLGGGGGAGAAPGARTARATSDNLVAL